MCYRIGFALLFEMRWPVSLCSPSRQLVFRQGYIVSPLDWPYFFSNDEINRDARKVLDLHVAERMRILIFLF